MKHENSQDLFSRATALIPGGVNSPVRAFKSVGGDPFFVERADGACTCTTSTATATSTTSGPGGR